MRQVRLQQKQGGPFFLCSGFKQLKIAKNTFVSMVEPRAMVLSIYIYIYMKKTLKSVAKVQKGF